MTDRSLPIAILGSVGVPARYGGFETLAEELVKAAGQKNAAARLSVWCSAPPKGMERPATWNGAHLRYVPLRANGAQSIPYDSISLWQAAQSGHATALLLGVSGALSLPLIRATSRMRIVTHLGGIEWQRSKWGPTARAVLKRSEAMAVRWSHHVIADNPEISDHIRSRYGIDTVQIAYGHEHALAAEPADIADLDLPPRYALALARAEPENNLELILETLAARANGPPLVAMANWEDTAHGRKIHARYRGHPRIRLLDAEYDPGRLRAIRDRAILYLHGHSAGGTNPALVEMMGFGVPVAAWDCVFNRATTGNLAAYFDNASALDALIDPLLTPERSPAMGTDLKALAQKRYRWRDVTAAYFDLLGL